MRYVLAWPRWVESYGVIPQMYIRTTAPGSNATTIDWDSRDDRGRRVAAGTYFGTLLVDAAGRRSKQVRKMVVLH